MGKKQDAARLKETGIESAVETGIESTITDPATLDILLRLRKVEGQVRGIQKMIEEGKDNADIINQMAAVRKALNKAGIMMITGHLQSSLADSEKSDKGKEKVMDETLKQFLTLA